MKTDVFLVCNNRRALRITAKQPALARDEIAIKIKMTIPDSVFRSSIFDVTLDVPSDRVITPQIEVFVDQIEEEITEHLNASKLENAGDS